MLVFEPLEPSQLAGHPLQTLSIHVRDHKLRELPIEEHSLEAHFGALVLSQSWKGIAEASRVALEVSYGRGDREITIGGRAGRVYELGPEPPPDDIDGRSPAVVVWHDAGVVYLIASDTLTLSELLPGAESIYE